MPREQSNRLRHNSMNDGEATRRCACVRVKFARFALHRMRTVAALSPALSLCIILLCGTRHAEAHGASPSTHGRAQDA